MLNILKALESTSSRLEKEKILKDLDDDTAQLFCNIVYFALDPRVDFGIKEYGRSETHNGSLRFDNDEDIIWEYLSELIHRRITGNAARDLLESLDLELNEDDAEILWRVIQRDLRCGVSHSTINKIWPGTIYVHPYMRCNSFNEKNLGNIKFPCISQTKEDGLYVDILTYEGAVHYQSRNGKTLKINNKEVDSLFETYPGYVYQGECLALDENGNIMDRSKGNGYLNSNNIDPSRILFVLWDMIPISDYLNSLCKVPYSERLESMLSHIESFEHPRITPVDTITINNTDEIIEHFKENVSRGLEGTVIKNTNGIWKPGTSKDQVKCKIEFTCELRIVEVKEGTGKNVGKLGALVCESEDSIIKVSVGGGYSDKQRIQYYNEDIIGQIIEVKANDILTTDKGTSLFLPRHVKLRKDKTEADTYERVKEQMDSFVHVLKSIG